MNTKMILTLLLGMFVIIGYSQEDRPQMEPDKYKNLTPEEKATKRTEKMTKHLDLSQEQADRIKAINLAHATEMDKIHQEMEALKEKAKAQREKTKSEIESVLNDDQKAKMQEEMKKHREEREEKRRERCCQEDK
ncbi:MAG: hypothetical protein HUJ25_16145 [Crocinitomicaceae bacterium]|nr:hypothetical protein [Crocinitomicaceae bacterium]